MLPVTNLPLPEIPEVRSSPCGYLLCGRVKCLHVFALPVEIGSLAACAYFIVQSSAAMAASWGTLSGLTLVAHGTYVKYGDLDAIAGKLKAAAATMRETIQKYGEEVGKWTGLVEATKKENEALKQETEASKGQIEQLSKMIIQINRNLEQFQRTNEELERINHNLGIHVGTQGQTNADLRIKIEKFKSHLVSFKKDIGQVESLLPAFKDTTQNLNKAVAGLDQEFDRDLDQFESQIGEMRERFNQIVVSLQKENDDLKSQVGHLDHEGNELRDTIQFLGEELNQSREMFLKTTQELQEVKEQLEKQIFSLHDQADAQQVAAAHRTEQRAIFETTISQADALTRRYEALQKALANTLSNQEDDTGTP